MFPLVFFVGVCSNCRVLLAEMESKGEPESSIVVGGLTSLFKIIKKVTKPTESKN